MKKITITVQESPGETKEFPYIGLLRTDESLIPFKVKAESFTLVFSIEVLHREEKKTLEMCERLAHALIWELLG